MVANASTPARVGLVLYAVLTLVAFAAPPVLWDAVFAASPVEAWEFASGRLGLAGWLHVAWGWWVAITLVLLQVALGRALLRRSPLRRLELRGVEVPLAAFGLGSFVTYCVLTLLAVCGRLDPLGLVYLAALIPGGLLELRRALARPAATAPAEEQLPRWLRRAAIVLSALFLLPLVMQACLPNADFDTALYHLPLAKRLLAGGIFDLDPAFWAWSYPGAAHLTYALFLKLGAETAITPYNLILSIGIVAGAFALGRRLWSPRAGWWAALAMAETNLLWELGVDARIDTALALYSLLGVTAFLRWVLKPEQGAWLLLVGANLGIAIGVKTTGLFLVAIVGCAGLALICARQDRKRLLAWAAVATLLVLLPSGGWYLRNTVILGDPVYSLLHGRVLFDESGQRVGIHEAEASLPAPTAQQVQEELSGTELEWVLQDPVVATGPRHVLNPVDLVLNRDGYGVKAGHWIGVLVLLGLLLPLLRRDRWVAWLLGIALAFWVIVGLQRARLRYVLPAIPLLAVAAGEVIVRRLSQRGSLLLLALITVGIFATQGRLQWHKLDAFESIAYLRGESTRMEWLSVGGYNAWPTVIPVVDYVNTRVVAGEIPADTTVFMVGEGRGNLLLTRVLPDPGNGAYRWRVELANAGGDIDAVARRFKQRGIRYLVLNRDYLKALYESGRSSPVPLRAPLYHLHRFMLRHGQVLMDDGQIVLIELVD